MPHSHAPTSKTSYATKLLERAHSPSTASTIHADKLKHKPLILHATRKAPPVLPRISNPSPKSKIRDARAVRRDVRNAKLEAQGRRRRKRPQPLSASEKRRLCLFDIPREERKYSIYVGLHRLWCAYMRDILGVSAAAHQGAVASGQGTVDKMDSSGTGNMEGRASKVYLVPQAAGPLLVSADYHGAELEVVRSRCVSRVGVKGIVVRDTKFTFDVITSRDEIKSELQSPAIGLRQAGGLNANPTAALPKEHSIFRFGVPMTGPDLNMEMESGGEGDLGTETTKRFIFELHGDQFQHRPADRANKKFKVHIPPDL